MKNQLTRRATIAGVAALTGAWLPPTPRARAASGTVLRIGVLTDLSDLYADLSGPGAVLAAEMAVEDQGGRVGDVPVEVISGDYQQKADVGTAVARAWFDTRGVEVLVDVSNSAVALSVSNLAREKNKVLLASGNISNRLTGDACSPNTIQWTIDAYALVQAPVSRMLKDGFGDWFFITADVPSGTDMENFSTAIIKQHGGRVLGHARHPVDTTDFSSLLLQAQASKAQVIAFLHGGSNFTNAIKQAIEFGLPQSGIKLVGPSAYVTEFHSLGCQVAQGIVVSAAFYWDLNDATRSFAKRFAERRGGRMPTQFQAGAYGAVTHYLKSVKALDTSTDGRAVVAKMKDLPTDDPLFGKGRIRIDGRTIHPVYVFQIKTPTVSKGEWDLYQQIDTIPAEQAWRPMEEEGCYLVNKT
jgi:branched-chain amino acid transport system substrate-binding protein